MRKTKRPKHVKCSHCGQQTSVVEHGTLSAYTTYGCRCGLCREARRVYDYEEDAKTARRNAHKKEEPLW